MSEILSITDRDSGFDGDDIDNLHQLIRQLKDRVCTTELHVNELHKRWRFRQLRAEDLQEDQQTTINTLTNKVLFLENTVEQLQKQLKADKEVKVKHMNKISDHGQLIGQCLDKLILHLSSKGRLLWYMYQREAISFTEKEMLERTPTNYEANRLLLKLLAGKSLEAYTVFLKGLKKTNQMHVYLLLCCKEYNLKMAHAKSIRRNYEFLMEGLDVSSGVLDHLMSEGVLDPVERAEIVSRRTESDRIERLLNLITRKPENAFNVFLSVLRRTSQEYIASKLTERLVDGADASVYDSVPSDEWWKTTDTTSSQDPDFNDLPQKIRELIIAKKVKILKRKENSPPTTPVQYGLKERLLDAPELLSVLEGKGDVRGVACYRSLIYVAREGLPNTIQVYNSVDFSAEPSITVDSLARVLDLTASPLHGIFLLGWFRKPDRRSVYLLDPHATFPRSWAVDKNSVGLSVSLAGRILVTSSKDGVTEYELDGELVRRMKFASDCYHASHAVRLGDDSIVVCHGCGQSSMHRVDIVGCGSVSSNGGAEPVQKLNVLCSFGAEMGYKSGRLNQPHHLAVDSFGYVYVADHVNSRVELLDSQLSLVRSLIMAQLPRRICLDQDCGRVIVGLTSGKVLVYKIWKPCF